MNQQLHETLERLKGPVPAWLHVYLNNYNDNPDLPYFLLNEDSSLIDEDTLDQRFTQIQRKQRLINKLAFILRKQIVHSWPFELFIMWAIVTNAAIIGMQLETGEESDLQGLIFSVTMAIFSIEMILKFLAEGDEPYKYFTCKQGLFNFIDFSMLLSWYLLIVKGMLNYDQTYEFAVVRFLRIIRVFTLMQHVSPLRLIMEGLYDGLKSSVYIIFLLFTVLFIGAVIGAQFFGNNDPANFGTLGVAGITMFQISTTTSWSNVAYISIYGCDEYVNTGYDGEVSGGVRTKHTEWGTFNLWDCNKPNAYATLTPVFYVIFIGVSFATMSLFIASICMSMFDSLQKHKIFGSSAQRSKKELVKLLSPHGAVSEKLGEVLSSTPSARVEPDGSCFTRTCKQIEDFRFYSVAMMALVFLSCLAVGITVSHGGMYAKWIYPIHLAAFGIFVFEVTIKLGSLSLVKGNFFEACESFLFDDKWNLVDTLVVAFALIELLPLWTRYVPVQGIMVFRCLHLTRMMHVNRFLPRLRAIFDSFGVGLKTSLFLLFLELIFNYIMACIGILLFRKNDPFHFSKLSSALFSVWRIETGDRWEEILKINMYGCETYPLGYPFLNDSSKLACEEDKALGYYAAVYVFLIVIVGGYIVPSLLVGVVAVYFQSSFKKYSQDALMDSVQAGLIEDIHAEFADWCDKVKLKEIRQLFEAICHEDGNSLDISTAQHVFCHIISRFIIHEGAEEVDNFDDTMSLDLKMRVKDLLLLLDISGDRMIDLAEFTCFIIMTKQVQLQLKREGTHPSEVIGQSSSDVQAATGQASFRETTNTIPPLASTVGDKTNSLKKKDSKKEEASVELVQSKVNSIDSNISDLETQALDVIKSASPSPTVLSEEENEEEEVEEEGHEQSLSRMEQLQRSVEKRKAKQAIEDEKNEVIDAYNSAWMALLDGINDDPSLWKRSIELLFKSFDTNGSGDIDIEELGAGIKSFGINLSPIQLNAFRECLDTNVDGKVHLDEFVAAAVKACAENNKKMAKSTKHSMKNKGAAAAGVELNVEQLEAEAKSLKKTAAAAKFVADESKLQANAAELTDAYESAWAIMLKGFDQDPQKWEKSMETLFISFDKNGDGNIDITELGAGMKIKNIQMSPMQLNAFREGLDKDGNGVVSYSEFMDAAEAAVLRQTKRVDPVKVRQLANEQAKQYQSFKEEADKADRAVEEALKKQEEDLKNKQASSSLSQVHADDAVEARRLAWTTLLKDLGNDPDVWQPKLEEMFKSFNNGAEEVDIHALGAGLKRCGIHMSPMQLNAFRESIDEDDDGFVSLGEFMTAARWEMKKLIEKRGSSFNQQPKASSTTTKRSSKVAARSSIASKTGLSSPSKTSRSSVSKSSSSSPPTTPLKSPTSSRLSKTSPSPKVVKKKPVLSSDNVDTDKIKGRGSYL